MNEWVFQIEEPPCPKGRPRMAKTGHVFTPAKTRKAESQIRYEAKQKWSRPPLPKETPVRFFAVFGFERPKSHYRSGKNAHLYRDDAPREHVQKPDKDNLDKLIKDALNGIVWHDDAQICDGQTRKVWLERGSAPRTEIIVTWDDDNKIIQK